MEWYYLLAIFFGVTILILITSLPVAFTFLFVNMCFAWFLWGFNPGMQTVLLSMNQSIGSFILLTAPLFTLMGEILFNANIATRALAAIDKLMGKIPGRIAVISIIVSALFAALSGSSMGSVAMLGSMMTPDMEKKGYQKSLSLGPIMGGGGLASIIPPSGMAVIIGAVAGVSVGKLLISGLIPGILLALLYILYIIGRCLLNPKLAPTYTATKWSNTEKLHAFTKDILPFAFIILAVTGSIYLGIATPTEAAALGALAAFILAVATKSFSQTSLRSSLTSTVMIACMILLIVGSATAFSQILSYTGATSGLSNWVTNLELPAILLVSAMMVVILLLGFFMDAMAIIMITIPIFVPMVKAVGVDPILFCLLMLINLETGFITPPFGIILFVMKGVAPKETKTSEIYKAAAPFVICNIIAIWVILFFPQIALFLPNIMSR